MQQTIGTRVKQARQDAGLSVRELARKAGMAVTTLYDLERGDQHSTTKLPLIAQATGYSASWLQKGVGLAKVDAPESTYAPVDMDASVIEEMLDLIEQRESQLDEPRRSNREVARIIATHYHEVAAIKRSRYQAEISRIISDSIQHDTEQRADIEPTQRQHSTRDRHE